MNSVMELIEKILISNITHEIDDLNLSLIKYTDDEYYKYDSIALPQETYLVADHYVKNYGVVEFNNIDHYTKDPLAVVKSRANYIHPFFGECEVYGLLYSNGGVFLYINQLYVRLVTFIKKKHIDLLGQFPSPNVLMEYKLTGKVVYEDIGEFYFIDRNL